MSSIGTAASLLQGASTSLAGLNGSAQDYIDALQNNFGPTGASSPQASTVANAVSNIANSFSLFSSPSRFAAFVIGIILIGGGILVFVFQPSIASARSAAKRGIAGAIV